MKVAVVLAAALALSGVAWSASNDPALAKAVAYWHAQKCVPAPDETMWMRGWRFEVLFGDCGGGDGHDQHVYFFDRGRFIGTDGLGTSSAIIGMWRDLDTIAFMYVLYRKNDPLCCATGGGAIVRYRFTGTGVKRLDPAPPRQTGNVALGR